MSADIDSILERFPHARREHIIPILQQVQEQYGYLTEQALLKISKTLNFPVSKIYSLTTFYDQFRFEPLGKYHVKICCGTACQMLGATNFLEELEKLLKTKVNQTSRDGLFSLEKVACLGSCSHSPVIQIDDTYYPDINLSKLRNIIELYKNKEKG
jgi:NADH-quinone oxidoreductase E subunit